MATWEDGPEYAPQQRPQYFADAPLPPLEQASPAAQLAGGPPTSRPSFDQPAAPLAPLAALVPEPPDERDPSRPFDVVTTTLTSEPGWGPVAAPGTQPLTASAPLAVAGQTRTAVPAVGAPWPVLEQTGPSAPSVPPQPRQDPYAFPAPGTPGWFAPPPAAYGEQQPSGRVDARQVVEAATPGLCICLALGGLIYVLAPVLLVVAVFLSTRVLVAQRALRTAFRVAAGAVALFAVVGLFRFVFDGDPWWSFVAGWSAGICWIMLGVLLLVVRQALSRPRPPSPPTTNPWG